VIQIVFVHYGSLNLNAQNINANAQKYNKTVINNNCMI